MKNKLLLILVVGLFTLSGCQNKGIEPNALSPLLDRMADRHDEYVKNDESLSDLAKETYLRSSQLLRDVVEEAK